MFANTSSPIGVDFAFPDVCLTPIVVPVPIPYPNFAWRISAVDFCLNVTIWCMPAHNLATFIPISIGDQPGVELGVASGTVMFKSQNILGSFTVEFDGIPATKMLHPTMQNGAAFGNMIGITLTPSQLGVIVLT